nr:unnamed protein product [Digitaria exilis]
MPCHEHAAAPAPVLAIPQLGDQEFVLLGWSRGQHQRQPSMLFVGASMKPWWIHLWQKPRYHYYKGTSLILTSPDFWDIIEPIMAQMVASAVAGETLSRIISSLIDKDDDKSAENMERLKMAHIKMESVLHVTDKWQITDVPLLRWQSKLKRAAQQCGDALQSCKQRAIEEKNHIFVSASEPKLLLMR